MASEYSVAVNGASLNATSPLHRQLSLRGADRNIVFNHRWANNSPRALDETELDFLTVVEACFAIDKACRRRGEDPSGWNRRINAGIAVRDPHRWQSLARSLQELFGDLTSDSLRLKFVKDDAPEPSPRQRGESLPKLDSVALLSGGADSLVGAGQLLSKGKRVGLISHSAGSAVSEAQTAIRPHLERMGTAAFGDFTITLKRRTPTPFPSSSETEGSERARTLLFVGVATVMARVCDVTDIIVAENGIMAVHVPISEARLGSYSTKTAAPSVLEALQAFASTALERDFVVTNPLIKLTKREVVELGVQLGLAEALRLTVSCWSINRHRHAHCGVCVPCIIRRISFESLALSDTAYQFDLFQDSIEPSNPAFDNIAHYLGYAHDLVNLDDGRLEMKYGEILEDSEQLSPQECIALHRRWGAQVRDAASSQPALIPLWGNV